MTKVSGFGFQMEMKYDYRGRRVEQRYSRTVDSVMTEQWTRRYLYDGFQLIAEIDASDGVSGLPVTSTYFWGYDISHTLGGAGGIGGLLLIDHDGDRYLPGYDSRGNVVVLLSESDGEQVAGFDAARERGDGQAPLARRAKATGCPLGGRLRQYDPYGNLLRAEGDAVEKTPFRYQIKWDMDYGMEADTSWFTFGLVDYGLRYYNPKHGRFINRDPVGEAGGLNLYEAFGGDPVNRWDLLGLSASGPDEELDPIWGNIPPPPCGKTTNDVDDR